MTSTLVVAPHLGALTGLAGALRELTKRRSVHVAVLEDPPPGADVSAFAVPFRRLTFGRLPPLDRWSHLSATVRGVLDCWRWLQSPASDEVAFQRALAEAPPLAARLARSRWLRPAMVRRPVASLLRLIADALPPPPPIVEFLQAQQPGILIVMPMFGVGSIVVDYLRAARELDIATVALPGRWDDLGAGAPAYVWPDCIALWNREQRRQAVEILGVPARRTAMLGACLPLDTAAPVTTSREEFCRRHGIDSARAVVLLAAGHSDSGRLAAIRQCVDRLRESTDPRVRDAAVIAHWPPPAGVQQRAHPELPEVVVPRPEADPAEYASEIAEALVHADVVVTETVPLALEAAARARPLVALLTGDPNQELARFCRDVGITRGWPRVADGPAALAAAVASALRGGLDRAGQAAARTIVRPHGPDLSPGFLMSARLLIDVADRRVPARAVRHAASWGRWALAPLASLAAHRVGVVPSQRPHREAMRILIAAPSISSLHLHRPIIRALAERGHQLALVFVPRRDQEPVEYERVKHDVPNIIRAGVLPPPAGTWTDVSQGLLGLSAYLSVLGRGRAAHVPSWLVRLGLTFLPIGARPIARVARQVRGLSPRLRRLAAQFDRAIPASVESQTLLVQQAPDAVLTLPDIDLVSAFEGAAVGADLLRAASSLNIPSASVASGPDGHVQATVLQQRPSLVLVWNDDQRADVVRDLGRREDAVVATGALSLDRWLNDAPVMSDTEFRAELGLPLDRPFAFFCASTGVLSDQRDEVDMVRRWVASLRRSDDHLLRNLPVLIRPPVKPPPWRRLNFEGLGPVVSCPRRFEPSGEMDVVLLAESVRYAAVIVAMDGPALTMAAALGKPAVAISLRGVEGSWPMPIEYLWQTPGTSVSYVSSLDELNRHVHASLTKASTATAACFGPVAAREDGRRPSDVAADAIERLAAHSQRRMRPSVDVRGVAMRLPLLFVAGAVQLGGRLRSPAGRR